MTKKSIFEIDRKVNGAARPQMAEALRKVERFIIKNVDPTFSVQEFRKWLNSDSEKPFKWNKVLYYWG